MREIPVSRISQVVRDLVVQANCRLPQDTTAALESALREETSELGRGVLAEILVNDELAGRYSLPACQDTGMTVVFIEIGQDVRLVGGNLETAINEGLRQGSQEGYLRPSVLLDPLLRRNSGDNTPCVLYSEIVPGDGLRVTLMPKGGGAENMSALVMLPPSAGWEGARAFVLEQVVRAGANPCPPVILGVAIGGTFDYCAYLAKKALLRPVGEPNRQAEWAARERELLELVNCTGIGPMGYGGRITALAVHIESYPCHLTSLPVAVNFSCHCHRRRSEEL